MKSTNAVPLALLLFEMN